MTPEAMDTHSAAVEAAVSDFSRRHPSVIAAGLSFEEIFDLSERERRAEVEKDRRENPGAYPF